MPSPLVGWANAARIARVILPQSQTSGGGVQAQESISVQPGILPFSFYDLDNSSAGTLLRPGAASAIQATMPFRGNVIGISFAASGTASGIYTVYVDAVATTAKLTITSTNEGYTSFPVGTYGFETGSGITVVSSATTGAVIVEVIVFITQSTSTSL